MSPSETSMLLPVFAFITGLVFLVWSADRFIVGASLVARHFGVPPLLIGMVIVGFGTSTPELAISVLAALQGNPGLALGNAYGSNITNIALILGVTAILCPLAVHSRVLPRELPILASVTILAAMQIYDGKISRPEAVLLLIIFGGLMGWAVRQGMAENPDALGSETKNELESRKMPIGRALFWLVLGLLLLITSSRVLVWGVVEIAQAFGVSDLIIGLTIVAVGTSLPELASSILAMRKGEHDIAVGNVIGSNLFNTLAVVGIAGAIHPMQVGPDVFRRDLPVMGILTFSLFLIGYGFRGPGRINRLEGIAVLACYTGYIAYLVTSQ